MDSLQILKKYWGYDSFRPLQKEIIDSVLSGRDTLGILPTGGGKSITFQVPGLILAGLTIVVTPLISLMKDQVDNLRSRRIKAVYFHSGMSLRERNQARERLFNDKAKFLYISPERLALESFLREIKQLKVSLIVVDEAHCISQWGHDFRPSYLKINNVRKLFPEAPFLALTASATVTVAEDICRQLQFRAGFNLFRQSVERSNLSYVVRKSEGKLFDIVNILRAVGGSAIVYVRSRKKSREIAEYLVNSDISASFYHAGLDAETKEERQNQWKEGATRVMVATNAFGMGIDKPDVRTVIHFDMPPSLEEYYQEAGRAGRDGLQSYAVLLTAKSDKAVLRRRLTMEFPEKDVIRRIYTRLCVFSHLEIGGGYQNVVEFDISRFCSTYSLEEAVVRPALRILGQAGYVEFIEETENLARIMVTVDRDELYKVRFSSPRHEALLTTLLRNYPGLFTDYVFINEKKLFRDSGIEENGIYELLLDLSRAKIIHYIPRRKTPLLYFPTAMEEEHYVEIGKNVYEERKETLRDRIEAMISYSESEDDCRISVIKRYFGEEAGDNCGHCDTCRMRKKKERPELSRKSIEKKLYDIFKCRREGVSESELSVSFGKDVEQVRSILREMQREGVMALKDGIWKLKI